MTGTRMHRERFSVAFAAHTRRVARHHVTPGDAMTALFAFTLLLAFAGYLEHWTGVAVIATGAAGVLWWEVLQDSDWQALVRWIALTRQRKRLQEQLAMDIRAFEQARETCRAFLRRYPYHVRIPFSLADDGQVLLVRRARDTIHFAVSALPAPYLDAQTVLAKKGVVFTHPLAFILLLNQEMRNAVRRRLTTEVLQGLSLDRDDEWARLWLRFALWERERQEQEGGRTLLYREELAAYIAEVAAQQVERRLYGLSSRAFTQWIDKGIANAQEQMLLKKRAYRLESVLQVKDGAPEEIRPQAVTPDDRDGDFAVSAAQLAARYDSAAQQVTNWLCKVFTGTDKPLAQSAEAQGLGYFVASSGQERVVFQVGWLESDTVSRHAVERAFAARSLEHAQRAVVLALGPATSDVYRDADELGVLLLPVEELDRLLSYHADRVWQTVEWSLRTCQTAPSADRAKDGTDNLAKTLELGLST